MWITFDEGYQFGLGVFETVSVEQGRPIFLSWHLERLRASLNALGIHPDAEGTDTLSADPAEPSSSPSSPRSLEAAAGAKEFSCLTEAGILSWLSRQQETRSLEHHALKIMVSNKNRLLTLRPNPYTPGQYEEGFRLDYSAVRRNETSPLTRHKTMNYGDCILEKRRAKALGVDELIFLNGQGQLCEGTTTNLFFVRDGILYTPPLSCGLLPGILRRFLLTRFPVREQILTPDDALDMDECFVTNSLMGVMPVTALGAKAYPIGPGTRACMEAYRTAAASEGTITPGRKK